MFLFLSICLNSYSQTDSDYKEMLGFACGGTGSSSKTVKRVFGLLDKKKYAKIKRLLNSNNNAERFLSVIICEKLNELNEIELDARNRETIDKIYMSDAKVFVCGGCTFYEKVSLKDLLKFNHEELVREETEDWVNNCFKKLNVN